ncbi:MAG: hypothetical protein Q9202_000723 [Teloschistes flavicans]
MGFWQKVEHPAPPTTTDYVEEDRKVARDEHEEKNGLGLDVESNEWLFEAGFGPGIPYLLSFFYLRHELGLRIGIFLSAAPLATTFAGALAYGVTSGHSHLANWRLLFLVEGLPTILMAAVAYRFLPASPEQARFLTHEETLVAKARGVRQVGDIKRIGGIVWRDIGAALIDPKAWFTAVRSR